ncbi:MAG: hypothetical protein J6N21_15020, partial [Butyrivibrio sp.]|nr:hypothetical protein [Butyrivibrio sp.]
MAYGFAVIVKSLRHAKKAIIEQGVSFGKVHPSLKYPVFVAMVAFIFVYNFFLHLFIQMHLHSKLSKALAYVMSAALIASSISVTAFANEESVPIRITAFSALSGDIAEQFLYVGDEESKISFPSSLGVTLEKTEVITTKKEVKKEEQAEIVDESVIQEKPLEEIKPEETIPQSEAVPEAETANDNGSELVTPDAETSPESDSAPTLNEESNQEAEPINESAPEPEQSENSTESAEETTEGQSEDTTSNENQIPTDQARNIIDVLMPSITVYAAEPSEIEVLNESIENAEKNEIQYEIVTETVVSTEDAVLDGVTWVLDGSNSSAAAFSSENVGASFVYIPVISGDYNVSVELPKITVNIIAKEEKVETPSFSHNENVAGYSISIDAPAGVFPDGTTVSINVVSNPVSLIEGKISDERNIHQIITFDISFWHNGVEIEPENGKVNVSISLASDMKETLQEESAEMQVFHIDDDRNIEEIACSSNGEDVIFTADEFSEYALVAVTRNVDVQPPIINSIVLSSNSANVPGYIEVTAEVTDDYSGVNLVSADFYNDEYDTVLTFGLSLDGYMHYGSDTTEYKAFN